jgi:hypothetical protein
VRAVHTHAGRRSRGRLNSPGDPQEKLGICVHVRVRGRGNVSGRLARLTRLVLNITLWPSRARPGVLSRRGDGISGHCHQKPKLARYKTLVWPLEPSAVVVSRWDVVSGPG